MFDKATDHHRNLEQLEGQWQGSMKVWFEPEVLGYEASMEATIRPILDGRFMLHEYKGIQNDKPFEGLCLYGYHIDARQFECAWIDSAHMGSGIMFSQSVVGADRFSVLGSYPAGEERWGWRTDIDVKNADEVVITAYNITPQGEEMKGVETIYTRKK